MALRKATPPVEFTQDLAVQDVDHTPDFPTDNTAVDEYDYYKGDPGASPQDYQYLPQAGTPSNAGAATFPQPTPPMSSVPAAAAPAPLAMTGAPNPALQGLRIDWTSCPTISLKNEGIFQDIEKQDYGQEFECRIVQSKTRYVYRAEPYKDSSTDIAFSYDRISDQKGNDLADIFRRWTAIGKSYAEKEYLEVLVEMVAPDQPWDGEYRILQVPPASVGRFSMHAYKANFKGNGNPFNVVTVCSVGKKIEKVANPFYPWKFELRK